MIISKTPFRISLFGGGTDLNSYIKNFGGKVIGFTFNRFGYILLRTNFLISKTKYNIHYSKNENVDEIEDINHPAVKSVIKYLKFKKPFELHYNGDLPALSGLGTSSSFTVGLLKIILQLQKKKLEALPLAKKAIHVEQNIIKETVGKQDQCFAAMGGFKRIVFNKNGLITYDNIKNNSGVYKKITESSILIFTKKSRYSGIIEKKKLNEIGLKYKIYDEIKSLVDIAYKSLISNNFEIKELGEMLDYGWRLKKQLTEGVSDHYLDDIYNTACANGAYGGKILGSGGGGFYYFLYDKKKEKQLFNSLKSFEFVKFNIETEGSRIISKTNEF